MRLITLLILFVPTIVFANNAEQKRLKIVKLSDNVYQHISYKKVEPWGLVPASGLVVVDGTEAHMIDTPWANRETKELVEWIATEGLTLKSAVVTHFHEDASGALPLLNELKVKTYATTLTNKLLKDSHKEASNNEISSNTHELADGIANIYYPGPGHTEDNIVVWLPKEKILFGGCFVKSLQSKTLGNTADAVIHAWPKSIQNVINRYPSIEVVVPGHGKVGDTSLLTHTKKLALSQVEKGQPTKKN